MHGPSVSNPRVPDSAPGSSLGLWSGPSQEEPLVQVEHVWKRYRVWRDPAARLRAPLADLVRTLLPRPLRPRTSQANERWHDFAALDDVSLTLRRGETVGVIGRNGSGKSTLLQIISGTLQPTEGRVCVRGRVAALLELGSGFNPDFTGRENVLLNASILGLSRQDIAARMAAIEAFADIGGYIDQPLKTYSSGMVMRLAFAVSVSVEPELLVVDEALGVGDVFFQQKCFERLRELQSRGVSLLFVSHDMGAVRNLCDRCILLERGRIVFDGPPEEAVSRSYALGGGVPRVAPAPTPALAQAGGFAARRASILARDVLPTARARHGLGGMTMLGAAVSDADGHPVQSIPVEGLVRCEILLVAHQDIESPSAGIHLYDRMNNLVFASGTRNLRVPFERLCAGEEVIVELELQLAVLTGVYTFSLGCSEAEPGAPNLGRIHDRAEGLGPITVTFPPDVLFPFHGAAKLPLTARVVRQDHA